jgi:hypothetical protein
MASSGEAAWKKYFQGKEVKTTVKDTAPVFDVKGNKTSKKLLKDTSIVVLPSNAYSSLTRIKFDENKEGLISFSNINKPHATDKKGLKPSDIVPKIVDLWLEPEQIVTNTKKYINNIQIGKTDKETLFALLDKTVKSSNQEIDITGLDPEIAPSEFFEILTSIKLSMLMRNNDTKIRKILGIPKNMNLSRLKIKIMIPEKANMPLLDYYISISASNKPEDLQMKISVKSKVKGKDTNTIKFKDAFNNQQEIDAWYKAITSSNKKSQIGQKVVAESAVNSPKGKALMFPVVAIAELFSIRKDIVMAAINEFTKPSGFDARQFEAAVKKLAKNINTLDKQKPLDSILEGKQLAEYTRFMKANLRDKQGNPVSNLSIGNGSFMCEKILARAAQKDLQSVGGGLNFYEMFYSQILESRQIAYAMAKKVGGKQNLKIKYEYYSLVNWKQEYGEWVALRSKNLINNLNDTLGMDIQEYKK